jgi:UDP-N-acetylmuramyl pentapeptide synthase
MINFLKSIVIWLVTLEAKLILRKYRPRVIAITGSVGKTSVKDAVGEVFSKFFFVRKSIKSFNSELGVPLTIIGANSGWRSFISWLKIIGRGAWLIIWPARYPHWLVLEIGADRPDDIGKISRWLISDIVIITHLTKVPAHIEFFSSSEEVVKEKSKLISTLKDDGVLIINADDDYSSGLTALHRGRVITVGFSPTAQFRADSEKIIYRDEQVASRPVGLTFKVNFQKNSLPIIIKNSLGHGCIYAVLFSLAAAEAENLNLVEAASVFENYSGPNGRLKLLPGIKSTTIIDDSYNSSPVALVNALRVFGEIKTDSRKLAILGDMLELGVHTAEEHRRAGAEAAKVCHILVTVGIRARLIAEGALSAGMSEKNILQYDDSQMAAREIQNLIRPADIILVKGSQGVRLEKVVEEIMLEPARVKELLVRQDPEWKKR